MWYNTVIKKKGVKMTKVGDIFYLVWRNSMIDEIYFEGVVKRTNTNRVEIINRTPDCEWQDLKYILIDGNDEQNKYVEIYTADTHPEKFI
jgi:hypothetical protein